MMISDLSVRRPVFATVMSLLLFILGIGAVTRLSLREFPDVERPVVNVETRYRGASSDVVESRITQIIENEISGIEGVERLNSGSRDERSTINVEFISIRDVAFQPYHTPYWPLITGKPEVAPFKSSRTKNSFLLTSNSPQ
jgi:multidrug efflux pump